MNKKHLFTEFTAVSAKGWKQKIQADLKGADYNETLVWESPEGIKVKPFYNAEDLTDTTLHQHTSGSEWHIGQEIEVTVETEANKKAKSALKRGTESLIFKIKSPDLKPELILNGIDIKKVPVHFQLQFLSVEYIKNLLLFTVASKENIFVHIDILGNFCRTGNWFSNYNADHLALEEICNITENPPTLSIDVSLYQNAGADRAQQLAYAMGHLNEYLNFLSGKNLLHSHLKVCFKVAVDGNYFFEIAKLRALRLLWRTLAAEYGLKTECHILASPSKRNKTIYDYNVNMLRTTTECMSAVLGGADTVCNLPYDAIYHKSNEFGERIARNQLLILKGESYLDKISNPSDGSYYIETLTVQLAEKALKIFKQIEQGGGFFKQLKTHNIQKKIKESAHKQQLKFDTGEEVLVGTNKYSNEMDRMNSELQSNPFVKKNPRKTIIEPITEIRLSESLEKNRLDHE
ncbi:methylmalonyl-CoA mutase subunit beta [uncultured Eudoraea sp.]|uniref:methylmalonyl-CoA mutase subunit beta n=1 Tax=uncultured Eudoraea sp. TaxID=1035614 RepID=UPI0026305759|nr:methylmalonyl-CoA mutase subunit beta [uncultured Eudoraea sp.]